MAAANQFEVVLVRLLNSASALKVSKPIASSLQLRLNFRVNLNKGTKLKMVLVNVGYDVSLLLSEDAVESESPTVSAIALSSDSPMM